MALRLMSGATRKRTDASDMAHSVGDGPLVRLEGVEKVYRTGRLEYPALRGIDVTVDYRVRHELHAAFRVTGSTGKRHDNHIVLRHAHRAQH